MGTRAPLLSRAAISLPSVPAKEIVLIDARADVNAKEYSIGLTALIIAALEGHHAVVQVLLTKGAEVNAKDMSGTTPLIAATKNGHAAVVQALLAKGPNVNMKDFSGKTALMHAATEGYTDIVKALLAQM